MSLRHRQKALVRAPGPHGIPFYYGFAKQLFNVFVMVDEHLLAFANTHGSTRPAAAVRQALDTIQYVNGQPGTPVLSVLEEITMAIGHTH